MYHLLVSYNGWAESTDTLPLARAFEYTDDRLKEVFRPGRDFDIPRISEIPALFASESGGSGEQVARLGYINHLTTSGNDLQLRYVFDKSIPPIPNHSLEQIGSSLGIQSFEMTRTHWSVKDIDLFRVLYERRVGGAVSPRLFSIDSAYTVEEDLLSVMMPFGSAFEQVYSDVREMASSQNLRCLRADDIWEDDAIIQDIVSLICRSKVVVCDCTGRNPNVFYEIGIAHTLGRNVVLITQRGEDVPFDIGHLRYIQYLNNTEGRAALVKQLAARIETIMQRGDDRA